MRTLLEKWLGGFNSEDDSRTVITINHAAAVLMVEVMAADDAFATIEADKIRQLLIEQFDLSQQEAESLLEQSKRSHHEAHDLYDYTNVINDQFDQSQKFDLIKGLWKVAYADGEIDRYEEHMIRKLAELLYVPHMQFIRARHEAAE